ncbi:hypothetical protein I79_014468 [Cricetulus griseus]|uniref:Uncharacterized protein n=1 Tax=Cricetulus griseus TaxID=10029 RepID=G3HU62_CRIGR|nr:hypothetical protein I79_014468 [Cricetulus griseus]
MKSCGAVQQLPCQLWATGRSCAGSSSSEHVVAASLTSLSSMMPHRLEGEDLDSLKKEMGPQ